MDIVVANGFVMERCTFFSREYHCCVLHNTRCKCEDYNPRNSKPITNADRIRSMSDEELCDEYFRILNHELWRYTDSRSGLLDWLRQEAET